MNAEKKVAILGGGNIGLAIADGLINSNLFPSENIYITRKKIELIKEYSNKGFQVTKDNILAVKNSDVILIAVQPGQLNELLQEISSALDEKKHIIISVVSGASIKVMKQLIGKEISVIRAMPNTAIAIRESMTCLSGENKTDDSLEIAKKIFDSVGQTLIIAAS